MLAERFELKDVLTVEHATDTYRVLLSATLLVHRLLNADPIYRQGVKGLIREAVED